MMDNQSLISALQGPSDPLFSVPQQHLQQMAGDVVPMPGAWGLMFNTIGPAGRSDMPGRYISQGPKGDLRFYGPDPNAYAKQSLTQTGAKSLPKGAYEDYYNRMSKEGAPSYFNQMHPSPMDMMRYFRSQGLLPD